MQEVLKIYPKYLVLKQEKKVDLLRLLSNLDEFHRKKGREVKWKDIATILLDSELVPPK